MKTRTWIAAFAAVTMLGASGARADQTPSFNVENFRPVIDPYGYATVDGARTLDQFQVHAAAFFNWAKRPLRFTSDFPIQNGNTIIRDLDTFDIVGGVGLLKFGKTGGIEVGLDMPIIANENGLRLDERDNNFHQSGFGTLRTDVKATLLDREDDVVGVALRAFAEWPTGTNSDFLSNNAKPSYAGTLIIEKKMGIVRFGVEGGYQYIDGRFHLGGVTFDDRLLFSGAVAVEPFTGEGPLHALGFFGEFYGYTLMSQPFDHRVEAPMEAGGGIRYAGTFFGMVGGYAGLNDGIGAPDFRIVGSAGITF